jgi:SAM-dependent methyltransferase
MTSISPACRFCGAPLSQLFADLGTTPLSNQYVTEAQMKAGLDRAYPLIARVCGSCFLVQADEVVNHDAIFDEDYMYFSSYSDSWVAHAKRYADAMHERFSLNSESLVVEIASNDGYLLQHFKAAGVGVLGVEPTASTATAALKKGIETRIEYFGEETGKVLAAEGLKADLMAANNVLAHVPDIADFASGFTRVLKPEGVVTFEFPHLLNLIRLGQFDTIYHEHYSYLSLLFVQTLMARVGLRVFDVEELPTHGGSLRVFACHNGASHDRRAAVDDVLNSEREAGLDNLATYAAFAELVTRSKASFLAFLDDAKAKGQSVYAYGAAAKGNTFFNVCGVTDKDIVCIADRSHAKQGKRLPGSHIPIVSPEQLLESSPDYVVIVPWNLVDEIRASLQSLADKGTRFVTTIPETKLI